MNKVGNVVTGEAYGSVRGKRKEAVKIQKEQIGQQSHICLEILEDIMKEVYGELYWSLTNDWEGQLAVKSFSIEGQLESIALVFVSMWVIFDITESKR